MTNAYKILNHLVDLDEDGRAILIQTEHIGTLVSLVRGMDSTGSL